MGEIHWPVTYELSSLARYNAVVAISVASPTRRSGGLAIIGSTLRARSVAAKAELVRSFRERFGSDLERGAIVPVLDCILPLESAQEAHELLDRSDHFGKVVLEVRTQK